MTTNLDELTPRELDILALIAEGYSNAGICQKLWITPKTLETHVSRIFMKMDLRPAGDVNRRVVAALAYDRAGRSTPMLAAA